MSKVHFAIQFIVSAVLLPAAWAVAQTPAYTQAGPIPPAIRAAKKIFISNAGSDSGLFPEPFSGDHNRAYSQFYAALKAEGQYELVSDPSDADLVLELRLTAPNGVLDPLPMFRLVVYDRQTHYVLLALTGSIYPALQQKSHDRNFDDALTSIELEFQRVTGKAPTAAH